MPIRVNRPDEEPSIKIDAIALAEQLAGGKATVVYGEPEGGEAGSPLTLHIFRKRIAELEAQLRNAEQFAKDIAHKLGIPFSPPVAKGECEYLVALEALKERAESAEAKLAEAEAERDAANKHAERMQITVDSALEETEVDERERVTTAAK